MFLSKPWAFLVFCLAVFPAVVQAQSAVTVKPSIVAIVDVQRILQLSKAAKSVQQQLDTQRSKFQTEIAAEETELRQAEQQLSKLRESAKPEEYVAQEQKLQQRFTTVERHVQARRKALDQGFTDSMNEVRKGLVDTVAKIAKESGVNLVIVKQQVIWNDNVIDITDKVLAQIDKVLPEVSIKIMSDDDILKESAPVFVMPKASNKSQKKGQ